MYRTRKLITKPIMSPYRRYHLMRAYAIITIMEGIN